MSAWCEEHSTAAGVRVAWLHGFLGTAEGQWGAVRALDTGAGPDLLAALPGHGARPWFPEGDSFDGAVEALARALPGRNRAVLVGYSMGARLAFALALRHPKRFAGALLLGLDPGREDEGDRAGRLAWDRAQAGALEAQGLEAFLPAWEALPVFAHEVSLDVEKRRERRAMRGSHTAACAAWALRALGTGSMPVLTREVPGSLRVPVRLLTGSRDARFTELAASLARRFPALVSHRVIADAGHDPALFSPAEVSREVRALRAHAAEVLV